MEGNANEKKKVYAIIYLSKMILLTQKVHLRHIRPLDFVLHPARFQCIRQNIWSQIFFSKVGQVQMVVLQKTFSPSLLS